MMFVEKRKSIFCNAVTLSCREMTTVSRNDKRTGTMACQVTKDERSRSHFFNLGSWISICASLSSTSTLLVAHKEAFSGSL
jgi:hypothetical protein